MTDSRPEPAARDDRRNVPHDCDVVVVGAGMAGLAAALALGSRDLVVLEATARVGGRLKSERRGPYWLNFGAHIFGDHNSATGKLIEFLGLQAAELHGSFTALAFKGDLLLDRRIELYPFLLPLRLRDRVALMRLGLRIRRGAQRYKQVARTREGEPPVAKRRRLHEFETFRTFADFLGELSPDLALLFRTVANRAGADPDELALGSAFASFAFALSRPPELRWNIIGGPATLPETIADRVGNRIVTGAEVIEVGNTRTGVSVRYRDGVTEHEVNARAAIVATPSHVTAAIVRDLPVHTRQALSSIRYGPCIVLSALTRETEAMPYDETYAVTIPGSSFNMLFNQALALRDGTHRSPGGSLMLYASGALATRIERKTDDEITTQFLADLYRLFPETKGIIEELVIWRWGGAAPFSFPGRAELQPALESPVGKIVFAGDYLGTSLTETAITTGQEAAVAVARWLDG